MVSDALGRVNLSRMLLWKVGQLFALITQDLGNWHIKILKSRSPLEFVR
jgi:hypothetical protein